MNSTVTEMSKTDRRGFRAIAGEFEKTRGSIDNLHFSRIYWNLEILLQRFRNDFDRLEGRKNQAKVRHQGGTTTVTTFMNYRELLGFGTVMVISTYKTAVRE
jgi:hypothetical protein